jgi:hypothetical protein
MLLVIHFLNLYCIIERLYGDRLLIVVSKQLLMLQGVLIHLPLTDQTNLWDLAKARLITNKKDLKEVLLLLLLLLLLLFSLSIFTCELIKYS